MAIKFCKVQRFAAKQGHVLNFFYVEIICCADSALPYSCFL